MTLQELKALAYDCMVQIEYWQSELVKANNQIREELSKPSQDEKQK